MRLGQQRGRGLGGPRGSGPEVLLRAARGPRLLRGAGLRVSPGLSALPPPRVLALIFRRGGRIYFAYS